MTRRTPEEEIALLKKTPKLRLTAQQEIAKLEAEIRELKAWADKNEGLMQTQDRVIEAVSKKVTELEAENAELLGALESSNAAAKRRGEENAELRKEKERLEATLVSVRDWKLPNTGLTWGGDPDRPVSFAARYGSQGEQNYIRSLARECLEAK